MNFCYSCGLTILHPPLADAKLCCKMASLQRTQVSFELCKFAQDVQTKNTFFDKEKATKKKTKKNNSNGLNNEEEEEDEEEAERSRLQKLEFDDIFEKDSQASFSSSSSTTSNSSDVDIVTENDEIEYYYKPKSPSYQCHSP